MGIFRRTVQAISCYKLAKIITSTQWYRVVSAASEERWSDTDWDSCDGSMEE